MSGGQRSGEPRIPTGPGRKLATYVVGFGVAFAVGIAPYLGTIEVPGFRALLSLYPLGIRDLLIPLSAFLMGVLAIAVEWYVRNQVRSVRLGRAFKRALAAVIIGFVTLVVIHIVFVERVPIEGGRDVVSFVVGWSRQPACQCRPEVSNAQCIKEITFDEAAIRSCWGDGSIRLATGLLVLSYLAVTAGFGAVVGIVVLSSSTR